ncbi:MAG: hypothetical protein LBC86_06585 [Oscillospiraceae bacterium]|jgi:hypothetical protein|nr:hypothetical protein [Oscillospiraceae bacterium]
MNIKKTNALIEYLLYKKSLTRQIKAMTDEQYMENPVGFEIYGYIDNMLEHYNDKEMDFIFDNQTALMQAYNI